MTANFYADDVGAVLSDALPNGGGAVYLVNPAAASIPDIVFGLHGADAPTVKLLVEADAVKAAMADFTVGSRAADLVAADGLSIRTAADLAETSLLVSTDRVVSFVNVPEQVAGIATTDDGFIGVAFDYYGSQWEAADEYRLQDPPLSRVTETLAAEFGDEAVADFRAIVAELPAVRNDGVGLDKVTVSLLVAARHGVLLYDVSRWGEDVGLASKATFSRAKGELEDADVITTEKVPIDVGRPRLRLRLATDDLRTADVPEMVRLVRERLQTVEATGK